jgi:intraflagellar transport protein 56
MQRPGSALSKLRNQQKNLKASISQSPMSQKKTYTKEEFIKNRDFEGAITLLEHEKLLNRENINNQLWLAYSYFHNGDFPSALEIYNNLMKKPNYDLNLHTYKACCLYALTKYKEGLEEAKKGISSELNNRVKFHLAFKLSQGQEVIDAHSKLNQNSIFDQLTLAALHYLKNEQEEAIEIYKKIYMDKKYDALNIYLSMCYYKNEYFDIALDLVNHYISIHPDSVIAVNLKACIEYSSNGNDKEAKKILFDLQEKTKKPDLIEDNDILRHNLSVFDTSDSTSNKLKTFSNLLDIIPEARQNLIIYYLRNDQITQAYNLIKDMQPITTKDYILKAIVHCVMGYQQQSENPIELNENLRKAQTFFQSIGASTSECDTIEGRQCMASCFRLGGMYNDELIYLDSIEQYMKDDDDFNYNYGVALAMCQNYKQAEEVLSRVKRDKYRNDQNYLSWICRCFIANDKPEYAWNLYISIDNHLVAIYLLNFIANEFYRMGAYYFSFKAFLFLEKFSPSNENSKGKISSAIGVFYQMLNGKSDSDKLQEIIHYLCDGQQTLEVNKCIKVFKDWGNANGVNFTDEPVYGGEADG